MDYVSLALIGIHLFFWGGCAIVLIFLIRRRIKIKRTEDFEDRSN